MVVKNIHPNSDYNQSSTQDHDYKKELFWNAFVSFFLEGSVHYISSL